MRKTKRIGTSCPAFARCPPFSFPFALLPSIASMGLVAGVEVALELSTHLGQ